MIKKLRKCILCCIFFVPSTWPADKQTRLIFHPTLDLSKHWFGTSWTIGNAKLDSANNLNQFVGIGYRRDKWWVEGMVQKQWSTSGNQLLLDFRFQTQVAKKWSVYIEVAPFLNRRAFYDFVIVERQIWRKLNVGGETENVHRPLRDSIGGGPRVSYPIGSVGKFKFTLALSYQMRPNEKDALRLYVVVNRRLKVY